MVTQPKHRQLLCAQFDSIESAMQVVSELLEFEPAAIELIDKATLDGTKANIQQQQNRFWIEGDPQAVLVCEWFADNQADLNHQMLNYQAWLLKNGAYASPIIDAKQAAKVWEVRKAGLGMLMGKVTRKKAVAVIEDAAVPVKNLFDYFSDVQFLMAELEVGCVYYGHASVGLIHIRPEIDLATEEGKQLFRTIAERNSKLVKKYRGAISGEHGDGRIRAPFIKEQVGEQVYAYLLELKRAFDPHDLLNPGVIIGDMPITDNLRADRQPQELIEIKFDWSRDLSLMDAVEKCNGAGACRKSAGRGVMCPSYQATREENYSTRGRSNLLRFALTEPNPQKALSQAELQDALEMCLGCKACKTECPANVDMAKLKAEVLYQTQGLSLSNWIFANYGFILKQAENWPNTFNWLQSLSAIKALMQVDKRRTLPKAYSSNLAEWWNYFSFKELNKTQLSSVKTKAWVLCDLYSQYQEPRVGQAVLEVLHHFGLEVIPVYLQHSPRALISKGLLKQARKALLETVFAMEEYQPQDLIVGIEPSELLVWRDEAKDLLNNIVFEDNQAWLIDKESNSSNNTKNKTPGLRSILSFEELVLKLNAQAILPKLKAINKNLWLHVHCHQKALAKPIDSQNALELIPGLEVKMIPSGCCGMSGEFGYKHYEVSKTIANQVLLPTLEQAQADDLIVATGTSCRHQLEDLGQYQSLHIAQVFAMALSNSQT